MRILSGKKIDPDSVKDALGVCAIFGLLVAGLWIAHGLGLETGGADLMRVLP